MVSVNPVTREIYLKIVYYGPGLGGKTTTLQYIHDTADPERRGKMLSLATPVERTLYFDYLPVRLPEIGGYSLKLQLFTVPGQIHFNATRKLVLSNADGVVFVADSQCSRLDANLESFDNLLSNLAEYKVNAETFPIVFHYNKRDLNDILSLSALETDLNREGRPSLETCALSGTNVYEGLELITGEVLRSLKQKGMPVVQTTQPQNDDFPPEQSFRVISVKSFGDEPEGGLRTVPPPKDAASEPLPDAAFKDRNQSFNQQLPLERPTIPAPFALSEKAVSEQSLSRFSRTFKNASAAGVSSRFTLVPLWPEPAKKRGMEIETAICEKRYLDAMRLISAETDLILSIHRRGNELQTVDTVIALLGLDAAQYKEIKDSATDAASNLTLKGVLNAYLFLMRVIEKSR
jgi:mutual gliding-motility protein MglA